MTTDNQQDSPLRQRMRAAMDRLDLIRAKDEKGEASAEEREELRAAEERIAGFRDDVLE